MKLDQKTYQLTTTKSIKNLKLFLISDIHYKSGFILNKFSTIISSCHQFQPDYIIIPGDIINDSAPNQNLEPLYQFLTQMGHIAPTILSLGNHDIITKKKIWCHYFNSQYINTLQNIPNVTLLHNQSYSTQSIHFTGITMPFEYYEREHEKKECALKHLDHIAKQLAQTPTNETYNITLIHTPTVLEKQILQNNPILKQSDLLLCGHLHGGLTPSILDRVTKNRGIIGPPNLQKNALFPKNAKGYIKQEHLDTIISTGVTKLNNPYTKCILPPNINKIYIKNKNK